MSMSSDSDVAIRKQLKIRSGAVKRLLKEHISYRKEAEDQQRKVDKYISEGADEWELRNQKKLLEETQRVIPDAQKRLGTAMVDLRDLVVQARGYPSFQQDEDLIKAEETLEEASI